MKQPTILFDGNVYGITQICWLDNGEVAHVFFKAKTEGFMTVFSRNLADGTKTDFVVSGMKSWEWSALVDNIVIKSGMIMAENEHAAEHLLAQNILPSIPWDTYTISKCITQ